MAHRLGTGLHPWPGLPVNGQTTISSSQQPPFGRRQRAPNAVWLALIECVRTARLEDRTRPADLLGPPLVSAQLSASLVVGGEEDLRRLPLAPRLGKPVESPRSRRLMRSCDGLAHVERPLAVSAVLTRPPTGVGRHWPGTSFQCIDPDTAYRRRAEQRCWDVFALPAPTEAVPEDQASRSFRLRCRSSTHPMVYPAQPGTVEDPNVILTFDLGGFPSELAGALTESSLGMGVSRQETVKKHNRHIKNS